MGNFKKSVSRAHTSRRQLLQAGATVAEASMAYANIRSVLGEFGASMDHIVDETFYVTNVEEAHEYLEQVFTARAEAYGNQPEVTQTLIGVNALFLPGLKLEIKCVAILEGI